LTGGRVLKWACWVSALWALGVHSESTSWAHSERLVSAWWALGERYSWKVRQRGEERSRAWLLQAPALDIMVCTWVCLVFPQPEFTTTMLALYLVG
jgi:hypothetical protein